MPKWSHTADYTAGVVCGRSYTGPRSATNNWAAWRVPPSDASDLPLLFLALAGNP